MLLLEYLERQVLADRHVAAVFIAAGMEGVELPTIQEQREKFDAALVAEPTRAEDVAEIDAEQMELRRALGVA